VTILSCWLGLPKEAVLAVFHSHTNPKMEFLSKKVTAEAARHLHTNKTAHWYRVPYKWAKQCFR